MSRITLDLIRRRSEHNEGEITTLEEISLHQENIEKIELIDRTCRDLRILLLQYNLISKIENLSRLKRLEYLNLALNNIEVIENLEGLESLRKLDLTVNFIGDVRNVKKLRCNENLEELILTGNPCAYYEGYRDYVLSTLTGLKELDMVEIRRSERIKALQVYPRVKDEVINGYLEYRKTREEQIKRHREKQATKVERNSEDEEENDRFWKEASHHTPEDRIAIAERCSRNAERRNRRDEDPKNRVKYVPKLFSPDGRPYNVNRAKVSFTLNENDDPRNIVLDVAVYKYLDTCYLEVDVQPNYVRVTIKGKVLQLTLPYEVSVERSTCKRNVTTGNLVITMPRLIPSSIVGSRNAGSKVEKIERKDSEVKRSSTTRREYLEIGPPVDLDFSRIVRNNGVERDSSVPSKRENRESVDVDDHPEVPPLE